MATVRKYLSLQERFGMLVFGIISFGVAWVSLDATFEMAEVVTLTSGLLGIGGILAALIGINQVKI